MAVSADLKRAVKTFKTLTLTVPSYMRLDLRQCSPSQPDYDAATGVVTFHNVSSTANIKLRAAVKTLDFQKPARRTTSCASRQDRMARMVKWTSMAC